MTDDRSDEPDFDDPSYAAVRDLLSSAKVEGSIPADVAARLEATLAGLSGAAPASPPVPEEDEKDEHVVVPLRRRTRWAPRLLAAAAVVVVAGAGSVGLNRVLSSSNNVSSDKASSSVPGTVPGADAGGAVAPLTPTAGTPDSVQTQRLGTQYSTVAGGTPVLLLTKAGFADQASGFAFTKTGKFLYRSPAELAGTATDSATDPQRATASRAAPVPTGHAPEGATNDGDLKDGSKALRSCVGPRIAGTTTYPVVLDTQPAALVVHPENAGTRLVEVWSCDGSRVLVFTTVPA